MERDHLKGYNNYGYGSISGTNNRGNGSRLRFERFNVFDDQCRHASLQLIGVWRQLVVGADVRRLYELVCAQHGRLAGALCSLGSVRVYLSIVYTLLVG